MDDFEAFRKRKKAAQEAAKRQDPEVDKKLGWVEGLGPRGPKNPKIKGFILGRYAKKKLDPSTLNRPKGFESTAHEGTKDLDDSPAKDSEGPEVKGFQRY